MIGPFNFERKNSLIDKLVLGDPRKISLQVKDPIFSPFRYETKYVPDERVVTRSIPRRPIRTYASYKKYRFYSFYHPYVCAMISQLNRYGIEGLLNPEPDSENGPLLLRQLAKGSAFSFRNVYSPQHGIVDDNYPKEGFDFDFDSPYGLYNWELFFHGPMLIASSLSQNQKFEEAQKWFHYIFDPTEVEDPLDDQGQPVPAPARYWKVRPFFEHQDTYNINDVLRKMAAGDKSFNRQLEQWMKNPFQPHAVARLRTVAYMKNVVMKYIENLIAWGDQLFRRDTIESINEATQLYILAGQILGPKPVRVKKKQTRTPLKVSDIVDRADNGSGFNNVLVDIESEIGDLGAFNGKWPTQKISSLNSILYFCTSPNDKLLGYWDTVADRLFKIRHCQNIEGVTRSLALFEPPIDPALLVKAAASGVSIGDALSGVSGFSLPNYRFRVLVQKAIDLCNDVKGLGQSLLSALDKKDSESLSLLRASQEINLLKAVRQVKTRSIDEAKENIASLEGSKELAGIRKTFYSSREYLNKHEKEQFNKLDKAMKLQLLASNMDVLAGALGLVIPKVTVGVSGAFGSPHIVTQVVDGDKIQNAIGFASRAIDVLSRIEQHGATKAGMKGGYDRRMDDWKLQASLAEKEIDQISKQITAAEIRQAIAEKDLETHDLQVAQSEESLDFMKSKFTNKDLYHWMTTQISAIYFRSYQLAFDVARMAERAYQYELGQENTSFVQFGHWDSLKKGLLSGERLLADLRRMEVSYLEQNKREYELTKHISLAMLSPIQLVRLRETGSCDINIPEVLFDLDHPGQYMRRIKSVRVTIPCVTGPYTNVNARLTLLSNRYRKNGEDLSNYAYSENDPRFRHNVAAIQSISMSSAQNDSGTFELNFQDERYLPFEGAGAVSSWHLELNSDFRQFDYDTISDVIIHMNYTAREGGESLKTAANNLIETGLNQLTNELVASQQSLQRVFSLKTHFPNALYQLQQSTATANEQRTSFEIRNEHFPHFVRSRNLNLADTISIMMKLKDGSQVDTTAISFELQYGSEPTILPAETLQAAGGVYDLPFRDYSGIAPGSPVSTWQVVATGANLDTLLNSTEVEDIYLVINYNLS